MTRKSMMQLGAAGALTAAAATGVLVNRDPDASPQAPLRSGAPTICIESNVRLVEGMSRQCLSAAQYEALRDRAVLAGDGRPVELNLASPAAESRTVRSCAEYDAMRADGYYALTGADMRREEYFRRACGALELLVRATPARLSHFVGGRADADDVRSMARNAAFGLGETAGGASEVSQVGEGVWKIAAVESQAMVFEIAHADFTGDGLGEILAYVSIGAAGGTARSGAIGFMEKPSAGGPCAFTPR